MAGSPSASADRLRKIFVGWHEQPNNRPPPAVLPTRQVLDDFEFGETLKVRRDPLPDAVFVLPGDPSRRSDSGDAEVVLETRVVRDQVDNRDPDADLAGRNVSLEQLLGAEVTGPVRNVEVDMRAHIKAALIGARRVPCRWLPSLVRSGSRPRSRGASVVDGDGSRSRVTENPRVSMHGRFGLVVSPGYRPAHLPETDPAALVRVHGSLKLADSAVHGAQVVKMVNRPQHRHTSPPAGPLPTQPDPLAREARRNAAKRHRTPRTARSPW